MYITTMKLYEMLFSYTLDIFIVVTNLIFTKMGVFILELRTKMFSIEGPR